MHKEASTALEAFKTWNADARLLVAAVHTTAFRGEVIELALVNAEGVAVFNQRLKPAKGSVTAGAQQVHGIKQEDLTDCKTLQEVWPEVSALLRSHTVVAYAPDFVAAALLRSLPDLKLSEEEGALLTDMQRNSASVIEAYSFIAGQPSATGAGFKYVKLTEAASANGLTLPEGPLAAVDNARLCLGVIKCAALKDVTDLPHLLALPAPEQAALPRGERWTDTTAALFHLVSLGWIKRPRPEFYVLPDNSLHFMFTGRQLQGGQVVCVDTLVRAACELATSQRQGEWTLTLGAYRSRTGVSWVAGVFRGMEERASATGQALPGLALMNVLDMVGWLA